MKATLIRDVKDSAKSNPFTLAYGISESCVAAAERVPNQKPLQHLGRILDASGTGIVNTAVLVIRQISSLNSTWHVPSQFTVSDSTVGTQRHLLFFTDRQLQRLARARRWYVDGAFQATVERPCLRTHRRCSQANSVSFCPDVIQTS